MSKKFIDFYLDAVTAKKDSGGGGSATLINKDINANGTYLASSDDADGYKKVVVNVPNSYAAGDEGKVVSNGALVAQTAHAKVTQNGTIDTTLNNSVEVAVQGQDNFPARVDGTLTLTNPSFDATKVTSYAFYMCSGVTGTITLPEATELGISAFANSGINNIVAPKLMTVASGVFSQCEITGDPITGILNLPSLMHLASNMFTGNKCTFTEVHMLSLIDASSASSLFSGMHNLVTVYMPNLTKPSSSMFNACTGIASISLPNLKFTSQSMFQGCTGLTSVTLPNLQYILALSFGGCTSLEEFDWTTASWPTGTGTNYGKININAFNGCTNLKRFIIRNTTQVASLVNVNAFSNVHSDFCIYVPDDLVDTYKAASNWSTFASQIHGLSDLPSA